MGRKSPTRGQTCAIGARFRFRRWFLVFSASFVLVGILGGRPSRAVAAARAAANKLRNVNRMSKAEISKALRVMRQKINTAQRKDYFLFIEYFFLKRKYSRDYAYHFLKASVSC